MLSAMRTAIVSLIVFLAAPVLAQEAEPTTRLTDRGRTMLGGSVGGWYSPDEYVTTRWAVSVRPSVTHFVLDRLGVGGYLSLDLWGVEGGGRYAGSGGGNTVSKRAGGGFQALYELELGGRLGLVVSGWLGYAWLATAFRENALSFGLSVPLLVHLSDAVGVGFGPYASSTYGLVAPAEDALSTELGVTSTLFFSF